tara:strand:+ start:379 stop:564 length:186 start_codon:yes stop_codon:yes gene_type:complete
LLRRENARKYDVGDKTIAAVRLVVLCREIELKKSATFSDPANLSLVATSNRKSLQLFLTSL